MSLYVTRSYWVLFVSFVLLSFANGAFAMQEPLKGPAMVTVAGQIEQTNRGAFDPFEDGLAKVHDLTFKQAFAFDTDSLEALGMKALTVRYPKWPDGYRFEGPLLSDVLKAVGAAGKSVRAVALDGYSASISMQDIRDYEILLAIKKDGNYLAVGGRGPAWLVFPRDKHEALKSRDDSQWVWSVYMIIVE